MVEIGGTRIPESHTGEGHFHKVIWTGIQDQVNNSQKSGILQRKRMGTRA